MTTFCIKKQKTKRETHTHKQTKNKKPYDNVDGNTVDSS